MSFPCNGLSFTSDIEVTRYCEGKYKHGEYIPGEKKTLTLKGSVQPFRNLELLQEELGRRVRKAKKIYSKDPLFTTQLSESKKADRLCIDGEIYEIHESLEYTALLPHFKSIAVLMDTEGVQG